MRKIETEMLKAIHAGRDWSKDNTAVVFAENGLSADVYLHGNHIAHLYGLADSDLYVKANMETWNTWPTMTTGSRLHALGVQNKADGGSGNAECIDRPVKLRPLSHLEFMGRH